jgi:Mg-chelatase subunit ChlD
MTNSDNTVIVVVLDRSGSMVSIKSDTEGGFNAFMAEQAKQPGNVLVTLAQFDTEYEIVYTDKPISEVPKLDLRPRGATSLLDAIGLTVVATGERLAALQEDERPAHVIVLVMTDGLENSSKEWTKEKVFELVKQQTDDYSWVFIFMGANQDAIAEGAKMGFSGDSSLTYDSANVSQAVQNTSNLVGRVRAGGQAVYTAVERETSTTTKTGRKK